MRVAVALSLCLAVVAVDRGPAGAFAGGVAPPDSGPHVALALATDASVSMFCSGTVIDPYWVLTAAHCFGYSEDWPQLDELRVISGTTDLAISTGTATRAERLVMAPDVDPPHGRPGVRSDVALVRLAEPILGIAYPSLSVPPGTPFEGLRSYGFGGDGQGGSGQLRSGDRDYSGYQEGFFFTTSSENAVCSGDSGGATMIGDVVVGVNAFIFHPSGSQAAVCAPGEWAGHALVELHMSWIADVTAVADESKRCGGLDNASSRVRPDVPGSARVTELASTCSTAPRSS